MFDADEEIVAALDKRKFLLKRFLEDQRRFSDVDVILVSNKNLWKLYCFIAVIILSAQKKRLTLGHKCACSECMHWRTITL